MALDASTADQIDNGSSWLDYVNTLVSAAPTVLGVVNKVTGTTNAQQAASSTATPNASAAKIPAGQSVPSTTTQSSFEKYLPWIAGGVVLMFGVAAFIRWGK